MLSQRKDQTMTLAKTIWSRVRLASLTFVAATLVLAAVAAATAHMGAVKASQAPVSAQVALDWNANAVAAVRAARTGDGVPPGAPPRPLFQPEGLLYLSYVQAAVYDAVT